MYDFQNSNRRNEEEMPSKNQYDLVQNDDYDTRIPLHPDEAFHHGITFQAKYIGTLDVSRPTSRVEIVAAMRRIRYEFKAKGIKKKKVTIEVSVEGLRVTLRKKKKKKQWLDDKDLVLMHHPIYRIFYVSHDSQDLKIFSYIARDGSTNVFKCSVFKSNKKSQAMRVVRTVGQAFEVCHKLSVASPTPEDQEEESTTDPNHNNPHTIPALNDSSKQDVYSTGSYDGGGGGNDSTSTLEAGNETSQTNQPQRPHRLDIIPPPPHNHQPSKSPLSGETVYSSPASGEPLGRGGEVPSAGTPLSAHHEMQLLREQLDQQCQQTQAAVAQIHLLRDQLAAETAARLEAQARIHQLLVHNKELLDHISSLVQHLQEQEKLQGSQPVAAIPQQEMQGMYFPELEGRGLALLGTPFYLYQDQGVLRGTRGTTPIQGYYPATLYPSTSTLRRSDLSVGRASSEPAPPAPPPQSPPSITTTLASLGLSEDPIRRSNAIQRSTSEKVPNRSELMSQVQRTAWARHTTK